MLALATVLLLVPQASGYCGRGAGDRVPDYSAPVRETNDDAVGGSGGSSAPSVAAGGAMGTPGGPVASGPTPFGPGAAPGAPGGDTYNPLDWKHWWEMEQFGFLQIRTRVRERHALGSAVGSGLSDIIRADIAPTRPTIDAKVVPALLHVLDTERAKDMQGAALIALARVGARDAEQRAHMCQVVVRHLSSSSVQVAETAALALGILGEEVCLDALVHLVGDTDVGAALTGRGSVPTRTRAFAAFGLGVLAYDSGDVGVRQRAALALVQAIDGVHARPDLPVAAMLALGSCSLPDRVTVPPTDLTGQPHAEAVLSSGALADWLVARLKKSRGAKGFPQERAFSLATIGKLMGTAREGRRGSVLKVLQVVGKDRSEPAIVREAAIIALGEMARAGKSDVDREALRFLSGLLDSAQPLERRFGAMALANASSRPGMGDDGLAGAAEGRRSLRELFRRGGSTERPWGALALGVQSYHLDLAGISLPDSSLRDLRRVLAKQRNAATIGAYGLGTALAHRGAGPVLKARAGEVVLAAFERTGEPNARGFLALALGLLEHAPAKDKLFETLRTARSQPALLWHVAIGIGLIGDERLTPVLIDTLKSSKGHWSRAAAATALGSIGDRRAVDPLVKLILDPSQPSQSRTFAIVGLGVLCEDTELPWKQPLSHAMPYAAMTATLAGEQGIFAVL